MVRDIGTEPPRSSRVKIISGDEESGYAPGIVGTTSSKIRGRGLGVAFGLRARDEAPESGVSEESLRLLPRLGIVIGGSFGWVSATAVVLGYGEGAGRVNFMGWVGGIPPFL